MRFAIKSVSVGLAGLALGVAAFSPAAATAQRYEGHGYAVGSSAHAYGQAYRDGDNRPLAYEYDRSRFRRCDNGATGAIVGAIAGGLLGNTVAGRGDHLLGTVIGGGAGALAGRAVERSGNQGYCR